MNHSHIDKARQGKAYQNLLQLGCPGIRLLRLTSLGCPEHIVTPSNQDTYSITSNREQHHLEQSVFLKDQIRKLERDRSATIATTKQLVMFPWQQVPGNREHGVFEECDISLHVLRLIWQRADDITHSNRTSLQPG